MTYYCFLCNEFHEDLFTKEHFIPKSIDGPNNQWLPVCEASNMRSNWVFDNNVRDILYMARYQNTKILKRFGEALMSDGTLKRYTFSYDERKALNNSTAFHYFFEIESDKKIPSEDVYAICFSVGLNEIEREKYCKGLAKISIGSLAYLLRKEGFKDQAIKYIFSQTSIDSLRTFALDLPWSGRPIYQRFSLGCTNLISELQRSCKDQMISNHVIQIYHQENSVIHIDGMLYSKYGWQINLSNTIPIIIGKWRLENSISYMPALKDQRDTTLSPDFVCIINPKYKGKKPIIPEHWKNRS
ncbi:MAG: hypothetical protein AB1641_13630 [Thermodesulfobacteriota bacterium]